MAETTTSTGDDDPFAALDAGLLEGRVDGHTGAEHGGSSGRVDTVGDGSDVLGGT